LSEDELRDAGGCLTPSASETDPNAIYALGSSSDESERLQRQADELRPESVALLDRVGLRPGQCALDLGCGPRGVIELLSERVVPGGRVVGVDADPVHVAMARDLAAKLNLPNVEVLTADARHTGLPSDSFDLVHARTLLITVPEPAEVVAEMVRLARPGAWVAGLEPDTGAAICYPAHPAFDRLSDVFHMAFSRKGADPYLGRRMAELYRQAGLENVIIEARSPLHPPGHSRRTIRADLVRAMRSQILDIGLATNDELDELDAAVREHLDNPETVVMPGLYFLAWGRKPASD
jgi:ubiquinone/menaquinone biosynthesis C-methylase UbiE